MLSWRYVGHPHGGGAEVMNHEMLRRLAARGHDVTVFSGAWPGCEPEGEIDGVRVLRVGRQWTVHVHAWRWLRRRKGEFDRIVDQINTIPFMTPLYAPRAARRFLIYQLAREFWFRETRGAFKLIAPLGYALEPLYLRVYRRTPGMTISASTVADLEALGFSSGRLALLPMAVPFARLAELEPKSEGFRVVMIGRLTPAKFVEEGIEAFAALRSSLPAAELQIAGSGDEAYAAVLREQVARLGIADAVRFLGRVSEDHKLELLRGSHVHLFTSHREGWGLTVTEAAAMGTPSVGYAVPGVRDSIADERLLAAEIAPSALADRMLVLARDYDLYEDARRRAWRSVGELSYDRTARAFEEALA